MSRRGAVSGSPLGMAQASRAVRLFAIEQHELPGPALVGRNPIGLVSLLVHENVLLDRMPESVKHHLRPAESCRIGARVEHGVAGASPHDVGRGARDPIFQHLPGTRVKEAELVEPPPHRIRREGQDLVVRRDLQGADREVPVRGLPVRLARQLIAVEQKFCPARFTTSRSGRAAVEDGVLLPAPVPGEIEKTARAALAGRPYRERSGPSSRKAPCPGAPTRERERVRSRRSPLPDGEAPPDPRDRGSRPRGRSSAVRTSRRRPVGGGPRAVRVRCRGVSSCAGKG